MTVSPDEILSQNQALAATSRLLFGTSACLRIVDPRELRLLQQNARFFKRDTFRQLVDNIRQDQRLSSVPLCHPVSDDALEVLSGNNRVKAAIEADLPWIMVLVVEPLEPSQRIAVQLSHNALVGQDDPGILSDLWSQIESVKARLYAGLSSEQVGELQKVKLVSFAPVAPATKVVTLAFTPHEKENLDEVVSSLSSRVGRGEVYCAPLEQFDAFLEAIQAAKDRWEVKNASLAVARMIAVVHEQEGLS